MTDKTRSVGDIETTDTAKTAETVAEDPDAADDDTGDPVTKSPADESPRRTNRDHPGRFRKLRRSKLVPAVLVLLLLISAGGTTWLFLERYQPNRQTDPSVADAVVKAASEGTVALLSYSPDSLDRDFASAKVHLSGDFLSYYNQFTEQIVAPAAKQKSLKTTAHVIRSAVSELHPDSAVVLVYVDQSTVSKDKPEPAMSASSVLVSLVRVNGTWLINKFDPV